MLDVRRNARAPEIKRLIAGGGGGVSDRRDAMTNSVSKIVSRISSNGAY